MREEEMFSQKKRQDKNKMSGILKNEMFTKAHVYSVHTERGCKTQPLF